MKQLIYKIGGYSLMAECKKIEAVPQLFELKLTTVMEETRFPDEPRTLLQLVLTEQQLLDFGSVIQKTVINIPANSWLEV